jgi:hypothetical protein
MSRKQGPHFMGMRPAAIAVSHRLENPCTTAFATEVTA